MFFKIYPKQMQLFTGIQFPLNFFAGLQVDSGGQRHRQPHVKPDGAALAFDDLNFNRIVYLHILWAMMYNSHSQSDYRFVSYNI